MGRDCGCDKNVSPRRDFMHEDIAERFTSDDICERKLEHCEDEFDHKRFPIGMCYVPWQCFRDLYENEFIALANGTIFKELDLKWYGRGCK
jgi:hypothetical protein